MNVYEKEIEFYGKIAPLIRKTLHDANVSDQMLAETYGVSTTNNAMLFEDLLASGYRLASVKPGYGMEETQIILSKIAMYHAACAVLEECHPNIFDNFKHGKFKIVLALYRTKKCSFCSFCAVKEHLIVREPVL